MKEIVHLQAGQCGNLIGHKFFQVISNEHGLNNNGQYHGDSDLQLDNVNAYFNEASGGKYIARSVMFDLQSQVLNSIKASPYARIFNQDNFIQGNTGAGNNWVKGYYTQGAEHIDEVLDAVRRQAQNCDLLQGFQITHSLGGGTGSGMGTLLIEKIKEEYPDRMISAFSVFPSKKVSDTVVQPYNATLAINRLIQNTDTCFVLDNQALYNICSKKLKLNKIVYGDLNHLIANAMSNVSCTFRFSGRLNTDFRKLATNLIPFARLHFLTFGISPLGSRQSMQYRALTAPQSIRQMFCSDNMMSSVNLKTGKYLSAAVLFRGRMSHVGQIPYQLENNIKLNSQYIAQWIPDNFKSSICDIPPRGVKLSSMIIANSTSIQDVFRRISQDFDLMFKRRAFLHWYIEQGMDQYQFVQASCNMNDLISDYQQYEDFIGDGQKLQQIQEEQ